jgi:multidrug efflux pump subunit AcrB
MFSVIAFGLLYLGQMRYSVFPELPPDTVSVQIAFPGASPEEVEEGVILKIEENLDGLDGVERVTSVSVENFGSVTVEATLEADIDKLVTEVKNAIDRINSFPVDAEEPVIFEQKARIRTLSVVMYGGADLADLKYVAEQFRDELLANDKVSQVAINGLPSREFSIEVSEADMRRYNLTFAEIAEAIRGANINISGGKIDTRDEEILIRARNRSYHPEGLLNLAVRSGDRGSSVVRLRQVATVSEQWEDVPNRTFYNGQPALILVIDKTIEEDILEIAEIAKAKVAEFNESYSQIQTKVVDDRTIPLLQRINLLVKNGLIGLFLVLAMLGFFLNLRLSFWVSVGIPFSFAGMFIVAFLSGLTINVISLFGMILVVGILVDDAIVVGENIFAHYEKGEPAVTAAINGTLEMIGPVTTAIMTTVLAFLPFFFLDGFLGKFIWHMAVVVVATLLFSLVEAFVVLPAHLAHSKGLRRHGDDSPIRKKIERIIHKLTHGIYAPMIRAAMAHKWITMVTPIALIFVTVGLIGGGFIGLTYFPFIDGDTLPINVKLVAGRQEADTRALLERIEGVCWEVNEQLKSEREDGQDVIIGIRRDVGGSAAGDVGASLTASGGSGGGSHIGNLTLELLDGEVRSMDSYEIAALIREAVGPIPDAEELTFGRVSFFGKPVSVSLLGNNLEQLNLARDLLKAELQQFTSLKDVTDTNQEGRRELNIRLKPKAEALGLTLQAVAGQVRQGYFGQEVQRIQRGRDEIRIWVRYSKEDRSAIGFLERMRIRTPDGREYPFADLAEYHIERGITAINHLNKRREIKVEASLAHETADLPPILAEISEEVLPRVLGQVQGVTASFEGQSRDQAKTMRSMRQGFMFAFIGMVILVILVFRSYLQAGVILSLIPMAVLGAIWGHGIQGIQLNSLTLYGVIALSGIIINDSIVFVDQINRSLRNGMKVYDAVYNAGISRLRPILLTSLTTSVGLAPIILETSRQAQFLIPMAVSVAYGLLFGTLVLLLLLPAGYLAVNRIRLAWCRMVRGEQLEPEDVEPAVIEMRRDAAEGLA